MPFELRNNIWYYKIDPFKYTFLNFRHQQKTANLIEIYNKNKGSWCEGLDLWSKVWYSYYNYMYWTKFQLFEKSKFVKYFEYDSVKSINSDIEFFYNQLSFAHSQVKGLESYRLNEECFKNIEYIIGQIKKWHLFERWYPLPNYEKPIKVKSKNKVIKQPNLRLMQYVEVEDLWPSSFIKKVYPTDLFRKDKHYYYEPVYGHHYELRYID